MDDVKEKTKSAIDFCIRWRYLIALIVFVFCVVFKLHGSSIAIYNDMFSNSAEYNSESILFGKAREIRSDEFLVHTPYYMSQAYNDYAKTSDMMSLSGQDMIVGYNAPVRDITLLAKPFCWGYVLLGNEYGLSWYWCSKLILLVLVSFELCMIITKKNKKVSLLGSLLIAFSPMIQWWFVPHMVDVFFWGITVLVLAYHFFMAEKTIYKNLFTILLPLSAVTFIIALFPSLQLPTGLVAIALLVAFLLRDKKQITFRKKDSWRIVLMIAIICGILGYAVYTSREAISLLMNTVYPGKRVSLGGSNTLADLFTGLTTFTLPFKNITYSNNCEISTFIHFAPLFLMLYPIIKKKASKDSNIIVGNCLVICITIMSVFMLAGIPETLAKITGFSYINRMDIAYGLVATLFTIWGMDMIWRRRILTNKNIVIVTTIFCVCYLLFVGEKELSYLDWWQYIVIIFGFALLGFLMLKGRQNLFAFGIVILVAISGLTVNPVARGTTSLFAHPLEQKIHELAQSNSENYWLAIGDIKLSAISIANGAKTLNAVNFYPDYGKWKILDPDGKYDNIYNRYVHMITTMNNDQREFLPGPTADTMKLNLSYDDAEKLQVRYLLTAGELETQDDRYKKIYDDSEGNYFIYERIE